MEKEISYNLSEAGFIVVKKNLKNPKTDFEGDDWNDKIISYDEANKKLKEGYNIGLVCGYNDFICIDCDGDRAVELSQAIEQLPKHYVETTTSGGYHHILRNNEGLINNLNVNEGGDHLGEVRIKRQFVVIAPSKAINKKGVMGDYTILKDNEVPYISQERIKESLKPFFKEGKVESKSKLTEELLERLSKDAELKKIWETEVEEGLRSEVEQSLVNKLVSRNFDKEEIFAIMNASSIGKWNEKPLSYRNLTYEKAVGFVTTEKQDFGLTKDLNVMSVRDYEKYKPPKDYIIKEIMNPEELRMTYGQTGHLKSMEMLYKSCCIASGKKYLGKKVKKKPVLILSAENSIPTDKLRLKKILRGLGVRKKNIKLYILPRSECQDILSPDFKLSIYKFVKENEIKVVFLDTINPLTPDLDDNKGRDVTRLFNEFLKPLSDNYGCAVDFLHHTDKKGSQFLGSTKFKANCDAVNRVERNGITSFFKIYNEKGRDGEKGVLEVRITFLDNEIKFDLIKEGSPEIYQAKKKMTQIELFALKLKSLCKKDMERKEIYESLKKDGIKFKLDSNNKNSTLDRAISEWRKE